MLSVYKISALTSACSNVQFNNRYKVYEDFTAFSINPEDKITRKDALLRVKQVLDTRDHEDKEACDEKVIVGVKSSDLRDNASVRDNAICAREMESMISFILKHESVPCVKVAGELFEKPAVTEDDGTAVRDRFNRRPTSFRYFSHDMDVVEGEIEHDGDMHYIELADVEPCDQESSPSTADQSAPSDVVIAKECEKDADGGDSKSKEEKTRLNVEDDWCPSSLHYFLIDASHCDALRESVASGRSTMIASVDKASFWRKFNQEFRNRVESVKQLYDRSFMDNNGYVKSIVYSDVLVTEKLDTIANLTFQKSITCFDSRAIESYEYEARIKSVRDYLKKNDIDDVHTLVVQIYDDFSYLGDPEVDRIAKKWAAVFERGGDHRMDDIDCLEYLSLAFVNERRLNDLKMQTTIYDPKYHRDVVRRCLVSAKRNGGYFFDVSNVGGGVRDGTKRIQWLTLYGCGYRISQKQAPIRLKRLEDRATKEKFDINAFDWATVCRISKDKALFIVRKDVWTLWHSSWLKYDLGKTLSFESFTKHWGYETEASTILDKLRKWNVIKAFAGWLIRISPSAIVNDILPPDHPDFDKMCEVMIEMISKVSSSKGLIEELVKYSLHNPHSASLMRGFSAFITLKKHHVIDRTVVRCVKAFYDGDDTTVRKWLRRKAFYYVPKHLLAPLLKDCEESLSKKTVEERRSGLDEQALHVLTTLSSVETINDQLSKMIEPKPNEAYSRQFARDVEKINVGYRSNKRKKQVTFDKEANKSHEYEYLAQTDSEDVVPVEEIIERHPDGRIVAGKRSVADKLIKKRKISNARDAYAEDGVILIGFNDTRTDRNACRQDTISTSCYVKSSFATFRSGPGDGWLGNLKNDYFCANNQKEFKALEKACPTDCELGITTDVETMFRNAFERFLTVKVTSNTLEAKGYKEEEEGDACEYGYTTEKCPRPSCRCGKIRKRLMSKLGDKDVSDVACLYDALMRYNINDGRWSEKRTLESVRTKVFLFLQKCQYLLSDLGCLNDMISNQKKQRWNESLLSCTRLLSDSKFSNAFGYFSNDTTTGCSSVVQNNETYEMIRNEYVETLKRHFAAEGVLKSKTDSSLRRYGTAHDDTVSTSSDIVESDGDDEYNEDQSWSVSTVGEPTDKMVDDILNMSRYLDPTIDYPSDEGFGKNRARRKRSRSRSVSNRSTYFDKNSFRKITKVIESGDFFDVDATPDADADADADAGADDDTTMDDITKTGDSECRIRDDDDDDDLVPSEILNRGTARRSDETNFDWSGLGGFCATKTLYGLCLKNSNLPDLLALALFCSMGTIQQRTARQASNIKKHGVSLKITKKTDGAIDVENTDTNFMVNDVMNIEDRDDLNYVGVRTINMGSFNSTGRFAFDCYSPEPFFPKSMRSFKAYKRLGDTVDGTYRAYKTFVSRNEKVNGVYSVRDERDLKEAFKFDIEWQLKHKTTKTYRYGDDKDFDMRSKMSKFKITDSPSKHSVNIVNRALPIICDASRAAVTRSVWKDATRGSLESMGKKTEDMDATIKAMSNSWMWKDAFLFGKIKSWSKFAVDECIDDENFRTFFAYQEYIKNVDRSKLYAMLKEEYDQREELHDRVEPHDFEDTLGDTAGEDFDFTKIVESIKDSTQTLGMLVENNVFCENPSASTSCSSDSLSDSESSSSADEEEDEDIVSAGRLLTISELLLPFKKLFVKEERVRKLNALMGFPMFDECFNTQTIDPIREARLKKLGVTLEPGRIYTQYEMARKLLWARKYPSHRFEDHRIIFGTYKKPKCAVNMVLYTTQTRHFGTYVQDWYSWTNDCGGSAKSVSFDYSCRVFPLELESVTRRSMTNRYATSFLKSTKEKNIYDMTIALTENRENATLLKVAVEQSINEISHTVESVVNTTARREEYIKRLRYHVGKRDDLIIDLADLDEDEFARLTIVLDGLESEGRQYMFHKKMNDRPGKEDVLTPKNRLVISRYQ